MDSKTQTTKDTLDDVYMVAAVGYNAQGEEYAKYAICNAERVDVLSGPHAAEHAKRIVLTVNCHNELLAACKAAREAIRLAVGRGGNALDIVFLDTLEATIAKAK